MAKKNIKEEESGVGASIKQLDAYLKKNKKDHLNFEDQVNWRVSTGSLLFDVEIGLLKPGCSILAGSSFGGKSSFAAQCVKNFLTTVDNSKGLWVKAEGRLDEEFQERSGVKFVYRAEDWAVGTCFVYETNIFESATDLINDLVQNNPEAIRYAMVIDSMDGLIRRDDFIKEAAASEKVGAAGLLTSTLFKKANLAMNKRGHLLFMIKQVRAKISVDKYAPQDKNASISGGSISNAITHSANQIYQFEPRTKSRTIEESGKVLGHKCCVKISKGVKERTDIVVEYPIKHGRTGGNSVWLEYEIADLLVQWGLVDKAGSWLTVSNDLITELKENNITVDDEVKVQGDAKLKDWLEENPEITKYLYNKFLKLLSV